MPTVTNLIIVLILFFSKVAITLAICLPIGIKIRPLLIKRNYSEGKIYWCNTLIVAIIYGTISWIYEWINFVKLFNL
jgi:hypothetical protein